MLVLEQRSERSCPLRRGDAVGWGRRRHHSVHHFFHGRFIQQYQITMITTVSGSEIATMSHQLSVNSSSFPSSDCFTNCVEKKPCDRQNQNRTLNLGILRTYCDYCGREEHNCYECNDFYCSCVFGGLFGELPHGAIFLPRFLSQDCQGFTILLSNLCIPIVQ